MSKCVRFCLFVCSIALRYPSKVKNGRLGDSHPLLNRSVTLHPAASMQRDCQKLPSPYATTSERDTPKLPFPIITMLNLPTSKSLPPYNPKSLFVVLPPKPDHTLENILPKKILCYLLPLILLYGCLLRLSCDDAPLF